MLVTPGADMWCFGCPRSASNPELLADLPRFKRQSIPSFGSFLNSPHPHERNSPCFGAKLYWGPNPIQKSLALAGNMGWKKKKHRVVHMALGEIENRWRQETNQTTIKSFQIRPLLTRRTTKPHTALLFLLSALFLFALFLQWTSLQLFSCQHRVWKSSPGSA